MTGWSGAASLMSRASLSALSSSGRTLMRVLIFSEKIRLHCAASRAAVWLASSCWAVEQRAYPIRIGLAAFSATDAVSIGRRGFHGRPGPRSPGTATSSSSRSAGTRTKRAVWYLTAVLPPRVRHGLPAGAWHLGQSWRSTTFAACSGVISMPVASQNCLAEHWSSERFSASHDRGQTGHDPGVSQNSRNCPPRAFVRGASDFWGCPRGAVTADRGWRRPDP